MATLSRTVRFAVNPPQRREAATDTNGYAGIPAIRGLGRHYSLEVRCVGDIDPVTGYLVNIKDIDHAARAAAIPVITAACDDRPDMDPASLLPEIIPPLDAALRFRLASLRWFLTPYYSVEMTKAAPDTVLLRQKFDFAASHRLHVPSMSDEQNRAAFGKCNNPGGHGHNYQVEPCVAVRVTPGAAPAFTLAQLEQVTETTLIRPFDHRHLNEDTRYFAYDGGVNSSVENIARVFFELLQPAIRAACPAAELRTLTVWETDRTSSTYPA